MEAVKPGQQTFLFGHDVRMLRCRLTGLIQVEAGRSNDVDGRRVRNEGRDNGEAAGEQRSHGE